MYDSRIFSQKVRELRQRNKMTQKELAEKVGTTAATISAYENPDDSKRKTPTLEIAFLIAQTLGVSLDWLTGLSKQEIDNEKPSIRSYMSTLVCTDDFFPFFIEEEDQMGRDGRVAHLGFSGFMAEFLITWNQLFSLYASGNIGKELYETCIEGIIDKFCKEYEEKQEFLNNLPF